MNALREAWAEFVGLFVDDGFLAIAILAVAAVAVALAYGLQAPPALTGVVLVIGCFGALVESVRRAARNS